MTRYNESGVDGSFYGMTINGGLYDHGTEFKVTPSGSESVLHSFTGNGVHPGGITGSVDGANPVASLVEGSDGANPLASLIQGSDASMLSMSGWMPGPPGQPSPETGRQATARH